MPSADTGEVAMLSDIAVDVQRAPVLRGLGFTLTAGECVGVVGANDSGKTTLPRVLATLLKPVAEGRSLGAALGTAYWVPVRPRIAMVSHAPALYPLLTLVENLGFVARLTGRCERHVRSVLETVGLERAAGRRAEECSQGMLRRAELARVLLTESDLLLLGRGTLRPGHGLGRFVAAVVAQVRGRGGGAVMVSHDRPALRTIADRVVPGQQEPWRGASSPPGWCSARGDPTRCSAGAGTGRGIPWRTPRSSRGWWPPPSFTRPWCRSSATCCRHGTSYW